MKKPIVLISMLSLLLSSAAFACDVHSSGDGKHEGHGSFMKKIDSNDDGKVSKSEHLAFSEERFSKTDVNRDGFVDESERKMQFEKHHENKLSKSEKVGRHHRG